MHRRVIGAALAAGLLLSACSGISGRMRADAPTEEELIVIGLSQVGAESDWRVANSESMKAVFTEDRGYRLLFDDARQKQENQISAIRKFIQQQVDYIVLMPISETGWDSVLQEAWRAGIPVILVDRMVDKSYDNLYTAHVGSDFLQEGKLAADWMETRRRDEEGPVYVIHIQGTQGSTAQLGRTRALEAALERNGNWTLLAQLDGDFTQAKTYEAMTVCLGELPPGQEIDIVYCENDNEAFGAIQALEENGYICGEGGVDIISFDATRNCLTSCLEGKIALAVECNPLLGPLVEEAIQTMEAGGTPEKHRYVEEQIFTSESLTEALIESREY